MKVPCGSSELFVGFFLFGGDSLILEPRQLLVLENAHCQWSILIHHFASKSFLHWLEFDKCTAVHCNVEEEAISRKKKHDIRWASKREREESQNNVRYQEFKRHRSKCHSPAAFFIHFGIIAAECHHAVNLHRIQNAFIIHQADRCDRCRHVKLSSFDMTN